jgi:hypothetical protein
MSESRTDALVEAAEAEFMYRCEAMAAPPTKTALGIAATRIGGGVALSMRNDVTAARCHGRSDGSHAAIWQHADRSRVAHLSGSRSNHLQRSAFAGCAHAG